ncbi:molybdopterin-dependent oxidoreductase [Acidobacteria bacterium AH-259-D05]|nr:molybdopterin-dependent oxidoreductase [Acidobacteria bacterium AH-259-D05]
MAALTGAAGLLPGREEALDPLGEQNLFRDFPERWAPSVCAACPAGCPVLLRCIEEKAVGVRPLEPKPCARAYAIPQELYHPDRFLRAQRRLGDRGKGTWQPIDRVRALQQVADLLECGPRTAFVLREEASLSFALLAALGRALRASVVATLEWTPGQLPTDALAQATGWSAWRPDLEQAGGIVTFAWDWLQAYPDPAQAQQAFAALRVANAPLISVGPRLDRTAMKSHDWIACRAGFEPLVALGIAHLMLKEGAYDHSACEQGEGFETFSAVLSDLDLSNCEQKTGVSRRRMREAAHQLVFRSFLCLGPRGRLEDQWPIMALNALLGRIGKSGGWIPLPEVSLPASNTSTPNNAEEIPERVLRDGGIDTLVIIGANPVFTSPAPSRWRQALARIPNVIYVGSCLDETSSLADLVLPLALPAERSETYVDSDDRGVVTSRRFQAALAPPAGVISPEDLVFDLVHRLGDRVGPDFPWRTWEEAVASLVVRTPAPQPFRFPTQPDWTSPAFGRGDYHLLFETPGTLPRMEGAHLPYLLTTVGPISGSGGPPGLK